MIVLVFWKISTMNLSSDCGGTSFDVDLLNEAELDAAIDGIVGAPPAPNGFGYVLPPQDLGPPRMPAPLPGAALPVVCRAPNVPQDVRQWLLTAPQRPGHSTTSSVYVSAALPPSHGSGVLQFSGPRMSLAPSGRVDDLLAQRAAVDHALAALVSFSLCFSHFVLHFVYI